ncbi:helix-turn-helix domain-containing protein [Paenibacillus contaminans]|uniref:HTH araC/xylS-type domain-containing protein n=1 Tax=Paenibacillus contaminans TaxID=450362 RepID=A0A329MH45_9BACL|nr:helix-turn-helix domain-containing protein [Paenibacillus contaminans]RAV19164.1 hypothetical protein DQG23_21740 [Paenibacillus contaminans]
MRKDWFYRLLFSYLPIVFMIGLSLLLLSYLTLNEMSKRSAVKASDYLAQTVIQAIDEALQVIDDSMYREIESNETIHQFFQPLPPVQRQHSDYQTVAALKKIMTENELIDSVYLYRVSDQMVLTQSTLIGIDGFGDKEFIGRMIGTLKPFVWEGRRSYSEHPSEERKNVISLAKFVNLTNRSLLVVNVSPERLNKLIQRMSKSELNFIELVNSDNSVIASNYLAEHASTNGSPGTPQSGKLLSKATSEYTGWSVRSGVYKNGILEWVSSLFYLWVAFGFIVIALAVIWLVYVTRRNYRPIQTIANRIADYSRQKRQELKQDNGTDEFNYIASAIEELLDRSSVLQEENDENLVYRKRQTFLNLLDGHTIGRGKSWTDEMERFGMSASVGAILVAVVEIDRFTDFTNRYNRGDQQLLKFVLSSVNRELADSEKIQAWSEWLNPRQMAILYVMENPAGAETEIRLLCEKLRAWVEHNQSFTITIGIGACEKGMEYVQKSYASAVNALTYKSSLGTNRLIGSDNLESVPQVEMFKQLQNIRAICQAFRFGEGVWENHFRGLIGNFRGQLFSLEDLRSMLNYLVFHLHKEIIELPAEFQEIWNDDIHGRLIAAVSRIETLDESCVEFEQVLREAFEQMQELREGKNNHQIILKVKQYISEHVADPDMSLNHLSDEFGLKPGYLSRLFKEEFGENFTEYVARERMNKAMAILKGNSSVTVQDIATAVGYTNSLTFIRTFKKYTGTTPGNYRKELSQ